jgi:hypothetical protein
MGLMCDGQIKSVKLTGLVVDTGKVKKIKFTLEQAMKAQRGE